MVLILGKSLNILVLLWLIGAVCYFKIIMLKHGMKFKKRYAGMGKTAFVILGRISVIEMFYQDLI